MYINVKFHSFFLKKIKKVLKKFGGYVKKLYLCGCKFGSLKYELFSGFRNVIAELHKQIAELHKQIAELHKLIAETGKQVSDISNITN
jgi:hypothetical protein